MRWIPTLALAACTSLTPNGLDPAATETCDPSAEITVYPDLDRDGYGDDGGVYTACSMPEDGAEVGGDCDDDDPTISPADADGDGFSGCDGDCNDTDPDLSPFDSDGDGASSCDGDCDDLDPLLNLDDQDADGWTTCDGDCNDEQAMRNLDDLDGDGYSTCDNDCDDEDATLDPADLDGDGESTCMGDCDDLDPYRYAAAEDPCLDGIDQDCDGADDLCREEFGMGSNVDTNWTTSNYFRGHIFLATADVDIIDFEIYLGLSVACDLDYYVHEGASAAGPWTVLYAGTVNHGPATDFHASPTINVSMVAGTYYGLGVAWNCAATYYGDYSGWAGAYPLGDFIQTYWDNAYGGFSNNYAPTNVGTNGSLAYYFNYGYN